MRELFLLLFLLHITHSQIFENELPVSLQPPPLDQIISKDVSSGFIADFPSGPVISQPQVQAPNAPTIAHPTVLFKAEQESKLPANLLNPFYKNPRIAEYLAKSSWFTQGEKLVTDRDTEKISREKIFYMLKSAGLVRRRRFALFQR